MFVKLLLYSCKQSAVCLPSCPSAYASISILDSVSMCIFLHCSGTGGVFPFKTTSLGRIYHLHLPPRLNHILPGCGSSYHILPSGANGQLAVIPTLCLYLATPPICQRGSLFPFLVPCYHFCLAHLGTDSFSPDT